MKTDITCPFCREEGFDLIGLKAHLDWCEALSATETLAQERARLSARAESDNAKNHAGGYEKE